MTFCTGVQLFILCILNGYVVSVDWRPPQEGRTSQIKISYKQWNLLIIAFVKNQTNSVERFLTIRMNLDLTSASRNEWEGVRVCIMAIPILTFLELDGFSRCAFLLMLIPIAQCRFQASLFRQISKPLGFRN